MSNSNRKSDSVFHTMSDFQTVKEILDIECPGRQYAKGWSPSDSGLR